MPPFLQMLADVVTTVLYLVFRLVLFPLRLLAKTIAVILTTLFGPLIYACTKYLVATGSLVCQVLSPLVENGVGAKIKDFLVIPDTTPRKCCDDELPAGPSSARQANSINFKPKSAEAAQTPLERARNITWRCRRLVLVLVAITMCLVVVLPPSGTSAVQTADSRMAPAFIVKHAKASAAPATSPRDPKYLSDHANFLVDKLDLDPDSSWVVRSIETYFDPYTYHGDAVYPDADHPVDTQSLPSLKRANIKLVTGRGFQKIHAPGQSAIRSAAKHQEDMLLNDFGEQYEPDVKGKKKSWLYDMEKWPRPLRPAPPSGFTLTWPPERVKEVAEEKERERIFFEALDRIKEQEELDRIKEQEALDQIKEQEEVFAQLERLKSEGVLEGIDLSELAPPENDAFPPARLEKRDTDGDAGPSGATDTQVAQELTATDPQLRPHSSPVRLLASGRGMRKKMMSNAAGYPDNSDENLFLRNSNSFDTSVVDLSPVLFIISTTYSRLEHNNWALIDDWARFMTNGKGQSNGAFALVSLHRPRGDELQMVQSKLLARGIYHHLHEDPGDMFSGSGGGVDDTGELPISPDPAAVRYANALVLATAYNHTQFELGGTPARDGVNKDGQDIDLHGNVIMRNVQRRTVFALMDDDAFVANVPQLMASLRSHHLVVDGVDLNAPTLSPDQERLFDENMYLAFPSDPYSDWAFHNTTTHAQLYEAERDLYGAPRTMANLALKYRQAYNASRSSDPWGDREQFLRNHQIEFRSDGTPKPVTADWHAEHVDPSLVFPTSFGGGAIFMAPHVASEMSNLPCMPRGTGDSVSNGISVVSGGGPEPGWDEQLFRCARANMPKLKLHIVPSFYSPADAVLYGTNAQSALHDDSDFGRQLGRMQQFTGGTRPIVMHNHRTWHGVDAGSAHRVTDVCGDDCFLQRYEFNDNWVLTNGYSLTHFPDGGGPGTNAVRVPRREFVGGANGTFAVSGVLDRVSRALRPYVTERANAYRTLLAFYDSEQMVVEQPPRPPGGHIDLLKMDQRRQTFRLLDTSVADDGTVMQAYVRQRDHGRELFVSGRGLAGGRADFDKRAKHMAVPAMVRGGLDGDERDLAAEDKPPLHDEVVLLLWEPPKAPPEPSRYASGGPLVSRGEMFQWHTLSGLSVSFVWTFIKVAATGVVLHAVCTVLKTSVTAQRMPQIAPAARMLTPAAVAASWSAMGQTGRSTCVLMAVTTALVGTYMGSATLGIAYLYGSLLILVAVLVIARAFFSALFGVGAVMLHTCGGLAVRSVRQCDSALTVLENKLGIPNIVRGIKYMFSALSPARFTRAVFRDGSGGSNGSGRTQGNGHMHQNNNMYGDDDVSDCEYTSPPLFLLAPPEDSRQQSDSTKSKAS